MFLSVGIYFCLFRVATLTMPPGIKYCGFTTTENPMPTTTDHDELVPTWVLIAALIACLFLAGAWARGVQVSIWGYPAQVEVAGE